MIRKVFKKVIYKNKITNKNNNLISGQFGLMCLNPTMLTKQQIESARNAIRKKIKKTGFFNTFIKVKYPVTKKPLQVRMGKGKGGIDQFVYYTKKYEIMFSIMGVSYEKAREAFLSGAGKLPCSTKIFFLR